MSYVPTRRAPDPELRLIVLYSLEKLGPCSDMQLLQFLFEYDLMNYFDMMFALLDMCKEGQAVRTRLINRNIYELTPAGRETLALYGNRIPRSARQLIDDNCQPWHKRFEREQEYIADYHQTPRGEYALDLHVMEQKMDMMRISLSLPDADAAARLQNKWPKIASDVYGYIISRLAEDEA